MKRTEPSQKRTLNPPAKWPPSSVEESLDPLRAFGLGIEGDVALGLGPGNGLPGLDDGDRVRRPVGDRRELDPLGNRWVEEGALAREAAIEGHPRLGRELSGTAKYVRHPLEQGLVVRAVPGLVELNSLKRSCCSRNGRICTRQLSSGLPSLPRMSAGKWLLAEWKLCRASADLLEVVGRLGALGRELRRGTAGTSIAMATGTAVAGLIVGNRLARDEPDPLVDPRPAQNRREQERPQRVGLGDQLGIDRRLRLAALGISGRRARLQPVLLRPETAPAERKAAEAIVPSGPISTRPGKPTSSSGSIDCRVSSTLRKVRRSGS